LVARHTRQLFPLLRNRRIFADVENFLFYDFECDDGAVDENVFAYSNEAGGERSLVLFNNRYGATNGRIRLSTGVADAPGNPDRTLVRTTLGDGLRVPDDADACLVARDAVSGLEHVFSCRDLRSDGMSIDLGAYQLHCFLAFREVVSDGEHPWRELAAELGGRGVSSADEALGLRVMAPIHDPIRSVIDASTLRGVASPDGPADAIEELRRRAAKGVEKIVDASLERTSADTSRTDVAVGILTDIEALVALAGLVGNAAGDRTGVEDEIFESLRRALATPDRWAAVLMWILVRHLGSLLRGEQKGPVIRRLFVDWHLRPLLVEVGRELEEPEETARLGADLVELMITADRGEPENQLSPSRLGDLFEDSVGCRLLAVNTYEGVRWFNRERFTLLIGGLCAATSIRLVAGRAEDALESVERVCTEANRMMAAAESSGFKVSEFLARPVAKAPSLTSRSDGEV
jgi:hypothetical protein